MNWPIEPRILPSHLSLPPWQVLPQTAPWSEDEEEATPRLNPYLADVRPLTPVARGGKRSLAYALSEFRPETPPPGQEGAQVSLCLLLTPQLCRSYACLKSCIPLTRSTLLGDLPAMLGARNNGVLLN